MKPHAILGLAFLSTVLAQSPIAGKLVTVEGTISVEGVQLPPGYLRVVLNPVGAGNELDDSAEEMIVESSSNASRHVGGRIEVRSLIREAF